MVTQVVHDASSHPVIKSTVTETARTVKALQTSNAKLKCKIDALIKFNKAMIVATKKLEKDLKKCT